MSKPDEAQREGPRGVLLCNLGGPETLSDVRPFLRNLFSDPEIMRIRSDWLRRSLAWLVATMRQSKSRALYRQIGGGSPIRRITEGQAAALSARLEALGREARVYVGMRCWKPTIDEAVIEIRRDRIRSLLVLPLFPQFSVATTGSCFRYFQNLAEKTALSACTRISYVDSWFDEPLYIEAVADQIQEAVKEFSDRNGQNVHLLYSAHSIPARYVEQGDPYLEQTRKCVELINSRLGDLYPSLLAFQSKVGPIKWLGPATKDALEELGRKGVEKLLAVPISFVSDHIETLQEIDILYKRLAAKAGIREFRRAGSLNLNPKFIDALAHIALRAF